MELLDKMITEYLEDNEFSEQLGGDTLMELLDKMITEYLEDNEFSEQSWEDLAHDLRVRIFEWLATN